MDKPSLSRFIDAQASSYAQALAEIKNGRKQSHWMWYVFSRNSWGWATAKRPDSTELKDLNEARDVPGAPGVGQPPDRHSHRATLRIEGCNARQVMGSPDDLKLRSSMTLFSLVPEADLVFQDVLDKFFGGLPDQKTVAMVGPVQ